MRRGERGRLEDVRRKLESPHADSYEEKLDRPFVRSAVVLAGAKKNGSDAPKARKGRRPKRARAAVVRAKSVGDSAGAMGYAREFPALVRLIQALRSEKIRFQIAGMSAAILQGAPATTLDTDIWIDLPERQYLRVLEIAKSIGANALAPTAVALPDDAMVNFLYRVDGIRSFSAELRRAPRVVLHGVEVPVLAIQSVLKSKQFLRRPKDLAHVPLLEETIRLTKVTQRKSK